jgi:hypothetical protein
MGLFGKKNKGNRTNEDYQFQDLGFVVNNFGVLITGTLKIEEAIDNGTIDVDTIIRNMDYYDGYKISPRELVALMLANFCQKALDRTSLAEDELVGIFGHLQISEVRAKEMIPIYSAYLKRCK